MCRIENALLWLLQCVVSTTVNISLDSCFDKRKNYYWKHGGETRSDSGAAMVKVVHEEVLEKELLPRVLEPCSIYSTSLIPVSSPWLVPTSITKWLPCFLGAGVGIKPQLLGPVKWQALRTSAVGRNQGGLRFRRDVVVEVFFGKGQRDGRIYVQDLTCVLPREMSLWTWLQQGKVKANSTGTQLKWTS